ncbi:MAG: hypothetical protein QG671_653 [Actinomycetota bacterium]|nr:hypothetical protein [Actinomycetota bacterium]
MTVTVLDSCSAMRDILEAPVRRRLGLLREMMAPVTGLYRYVPGEVDLATMHRFAFGFPVDRAVDRCREALDVLREADAWTRIRRALDDAVEVQRRATPAAAIPDITVVLVLGDPEDDHFTHECLGVSGNGSVTGYIALTLWPFPENVERLEATAVHELNHNLRYAPGGVVWDPRSVTVGEQVVSEGLADAFARQLYGDALGRTRIGVPSLDDDAIFEKVVSGLEVTDMRNFTAWVHGDASARRFGVRPVGLPTGAGYAAGNRLVDAYLSATGRTAADALHIPSREIIDTALGRAGGGS